ncbi:unnamed protein product [Polarella glacialis]|uniref:Uncharacterized protein n=1 Tax=Polarella glacialis TaxID=89957 RepID=A0A813J2A0_POLGL|nr:unnamed protein product [Polarella glacialis]CAE8662227.1 unnamed protein product [Polarella glacialis]
MAMSDVQTVCQVLSSAGLFGFEGAAPESARAMVAAALPHAAGQHSYQKEMLGLAFSALSSARAAADARSQSAGQQAAMAEGPITEAAAALALAKAASQQARSSVEKRASALEEQKIKVQQATVDEAEAKKEKEQLVTARDEVAYRHSVVLAAMEAEELAEDTVDIILEILRAAAAEPTLMAAVPAALALSASQRGQFDDITIEELNQVLATYAAKLAGQSLEAENLAGDMISEALGCEALREVEEEREAAAAAALSHAVETVDVRWGEELAAEQALEERQADHSNYLALQVLAQDSILTLDAAAAAVERLGNPVAVVEVTALEPPEVADVEMTAVDEAARESKVAMVEHAMVDVMARVRLGA